MLILKQQRRQSPFDCHAVIVVEALCLAEALKNWFSASQFANVLRLAFVASCGRCSTGLSCYLCETQDNTGAPIISFKDADLVGLQMTLTSVQDLRVSLGSELELSIYVH